MRYSTIVIAFIGLTAMTASAQVHRCKDATGKTIYSDQPCTSGQSGAQIERQRSQSEILQEREQAYEAELRKQDRRFAEQERANTSPPRGLSAQPTTVFTQPTEGWQQRKDRENAATSASSIKKNGGQWDAQAEAERAKARAEAARRQQAVQTTSPITNCNGSVCYDAAGGIYNRNGAFMYRTDGRVCTLQGSLAVCN
jgi:hypothetical protein